MKCQMHQLINGLQDKNIKLILKLEKSRGLDLYVSYGQSLVGSGCMDIWLMTGPNFK